MDLLFTRIPFFSKAIAFVLIWFFETWRPMFAAQLKGRYQHALRNILMALFNVLLLGLFVKTITTRVCAWADLHQLGLLHQIDFPNFFESVLALLLIDGWMYLWHRLNHKTSFLWRFHRMHHTDTALDVTSASRFHPGELFFSALLRTCLIPVFGLAVLHIVLYEFVLMPVILFCHSNVAIPEKWDRPLRALIVTPRMHWVHHSDFEKETDSNYSSIFSFWDRLAKTFVIRKDPEKICYGIADKKVERLQSIPEMLKTPFI